MTLATTTQVRAAIREAMKRLDATDSGNWTDKIRASQDRIHNRTVAFRFWFTATEPIVQEARAILEAQGLEASMFATSDYIRARCIAA